MKYTLIVGTKTWSSWSLRAYLALRATKTSFEEIVIGLRQQPLTGDAISRFSKAGRVPILKIEEEGKSWTVSDSLAICETLAERHREANLWPREPSTRAVARSYACEMHSGFPDLRDQLSMNFSRVCPLPELRNDTRDQIARIQQAWQLALEQHGDKGGFLFGGFSIADCMYAPVVSRFITYGVQVSPVVKAYMDRIMALSSMQDWEADCRREAEQGVQTL